LKLLNSENQVWQLHCVKPEAFYVICYWMRC
jgi:hypothetical protein